MQDARDLIDQTVLVKLASAEGLAFTGVPRDGAFFCKVTAVDEVGMWVENRRFATVEIRDGRGRYVPKRRQKVERHEVDLLIPWRIVHTVVRFRKEEAAKAAANVLGDEPAPGRCIGFVK